MGLVCSLKTPVAAQGAKTAAGGEKLQNLADLVVAADQAGDLIYAADSSGAIFYLRVAPGETGSRSYDDFKLLIRTTPDFPKPSGLAYSQGRLLGCDPSADACFEVTLGPQDTALGLKQLFRKGAVSAPEHIALSDSGLMAVGSDKEVHYFAPGSEEPKPLAEGISDIDRIAFDGDNLIVLNESGPGELYRYDINPGARPGADGLRDQPKLLSAEIRKRLPHIKDFALSRGIFYVAGSKELLTFARPAPRAEAEPEVLPVVSGADAPGDINRIAVSRDRIFVSDQSARTLLVAARPIPIVVDFPKASSDASNEQADILEALTRNETVQRRTVVTRMLYQSVNEFVKAEMFGEAEQPAASSLTRGGKAAKDRAVNSDGEVPPPLPADPPALARISRLVCGLNNWDCETGRGYVVTRKDSKLGQGYAVVIPAAAVRGYYANRFVTASEYQPLDVFLTRRGIIPLSSHTLSLVPGDIIKIDSEQTTPRVVDKCSIGATGLSPENIIGSAPTVLGSELLVEPDYFARQFDLKGSGRELERLGVAGVVVHYADVRVEKLKLSIADKSRVCPQVTSEPGHNVVDRIVLATSASYRFLDDNGRVVFPDPKRLSALGLTGTPDPAQEGGWLVTGRLNIGYGAFSFTSWSPAQMRDSMGVSYLQPIIPTTKVYAQNLTLLTRAEGADGVLKGLQDRAAQSKVRFYPFSPQDSDAPSRIVGKSLGPAAVAPADMQEAISARERLKKFINFPKELKYALDDITVGIVEDPKTLDEYHECFFASSEWSWGESAPSVDPNRIVPSEFHGTHVSAIIGAKSKLPGLTPTIKLVNIDPLRLLTEMSAHEVGVQIYNISVEVPPDSNHQTLVGRIKSGDLGDHQMLLVVAAGDDNQDYSAPAFTPKPPVVWLRDLPDSLIVVGSSTASSSPGRSSFSDYSKKYVQLLAPGEEIYSAASNNNYAALSGASQAAPQVTAVAALLKLKFTSASWIKAILIYTADWQPALLDDVWGGVLNAERAIDVLGDAPNSIWTKGRPDPEFAILADRGRFNITIKSGAFINDPNVKRDARVQLSEDIVLPFKDVLRVQRTGDGGPFRVVYRDHEGVMRIVYDATIEGVVKCTVSSETRDGKDVPKAGDACARLTNKKPGESGEFDFTRFDDYIGKPPLGPIKFPKVIG